MPQPSEEEPCGGEDEDLSPNLRNLTDQVSQASLQPSQSHQHSYYSQIDSPDENVDNNSVTCTHPASQAEYQLPEFPGRATLSRALRATTTTDHGEDIPKKCVRKKKKQAPLEHPDTKFATALEKRMQDEAFQTSLPSLVKQHQQRKKLEEEAEAQATIASDPLNHNSESSPRHPEKEKRAEDAKPVEPKAKNDSKLPAWDRCVDVEVFGGKEKKRKPTDRARITQNRFDQSLSKYRLMHSHPRGSNDKASYFKLPLSIRFQIAKLVIAGADREKPIVLNSSFHQEDAWNEDSFVPWRVVLKSLDGCLISCFGMRADIMVVIFTTFRFHVTFNAYVREEECPLATKFLQRYAFLMQRLTVEVDLTRLGGGVTGGWARFGYGEQTIEVLVNGFVKAMELRKGLPQMENLVLACRKFYGARPLTPQNALGQGCKSIRVHDAYPGFGLFH